MVEQLGCCLQPFVALLSRPLQLHLMVQLVGFAQRWRSGRHAAAAAPPAPRKLVQVSAPVAGVDTEVGCGQLAHSCGKPHLVVTAAVLLG